MVWTAVIKDIDHVKRVTAEPDLADRWAAAVGRWLADASLLADTHNLCAALETLRTAHMSLSRDLAPEANRLDGMMCAFAETARACLDRARQTRLAATLDPQTLAARMLLMIDDEPGISSAQVTLQLGVDESQISRSGRALIERGLAVKDRHGKERTWRCTPRGAFTAQQTRQRAENRQVAMPQQHQATLHRSPIASAAGSAPIPSRE
jgi:hypothetical protein